MDHPRLLTNCELAAILGCSVRTIQLRAAAGQIPGGLMLWGCSPRWRRDVIELWIRQGCPEDLSEFSRSIAQNQTGLEMVQHDAIAID